MIKKKFVIIGAGPTGLGAGHRLKELGERDFLILEGEDYVGGLSASFTDPQGFTWDVGGHVLFSHYPYFGELIGRLWGDDLLAHRRDAWIRIAGTWVPYPFQNNIRYLPKELQWQCVAGLLHRQADARVENFQEWAEKIFGTGIAEQFMLPYNYKVWAHPLEMLDFHWIGERISVVEVESVLRHLVLGEDDVSWGANQTFHFPRYGGTGALFRRIAQGVEDGILLSQEVVELDLHNRHLRTRQGLEVAWEHLLNTGPLDKLVLSLIRPEASRLHQAARELKHNSVAVVGIGVRGRREDTRTWMYFPEAAYPFYRVTNFHNYSPHNVAHPGQERALMAEVAFSPFKPENLTPVAERTVRGLEDAALLDSGERQAVVSRWEMQAEYAYPIPCRDRDRALGVLMPFLEECQIYSRGRFGGWKYEVGNMDHSFMQGVQWAERMVEGREEEIFSPGGRQRG